MGVIKKFLEKRLSFLVILILGIILLLPVFFNGITNNPTLWYLVEWGFWILVFVVSRIERLNFLWTRTWLWLVNGTVSWSMTGEFYTEVTTDAFEKSINNILNIYPESKLWHKKEDEAILKLPKIGGSIRILTTFVQNGIDELNTVYVLEISDLYVPFRQSEKSLNFLISLIDNAIKPELNSKSEKYTLNVKFGDTNPYFGLFIKKFKISDKNSLTFNVQFKDVDDLSQGNVAVSVEKLSLITRNLLSLKLFSQKYITLSSLDMTNS